MNCRNSVTLWLVPALATILLPQVFVYGEDWPMFGRDNTRNAVSPEKNPPLTWNVNKPEKNIRWSADLGRQSVGAPVISGGFVWVGTNTRKGKDASVIKCFAEKDGKLLYEYVSPRLAGSRNGGGIHDYQHVSMSSSPLVERDRLWFLTNRWEVVCLNIAPLRKKTGQPTVVWKLDLIKELNVFPIRPQECAEHVPVCSICGYKDNLYVITGNGVDPSAENSKGSPKAPSLVCLKKRSGQVVWQDNSPGNNLHSGQWASPTVIEVNGKAQVVAPQGDGWVRSFDAMTGKKLWELDTNPVADRWQNNNWETWNNVLATPVFYKNRIYIANGRHDILMMAHRGHLNPGWIYCIDPTKRGNISYELDKGNGRAVPNPNSGVVWRFGGINPKAKNRFDLPRFHFGCTTSTLAVRDNLVIAAESRGWVHCLDATTGKKYWTHDLRTNICSSPLIVDRKVYVASEDGDLFLFELAKRKHILADLDDLYMEDVIRCSPVYANGTLYITTNTKLFAIRNSEKK